MSLIRKNLLELRLDALALDIAKVRAAVERAEQRGQYLREATENLTPHIRELRTVRNTLRSLVHAMEEDEQQDEGRISDLLSDMTLNLDRDLRETPALIDEVLAAVNHAVRCLALAMATTVSLKEPSNSLQDSLNQRCGELERRLVVLRKEVTAEGATAGRKQWLDYQSLLDEKARPIFVEYVDFLGGLTVRDTGLDDLVCDMTEAVLGRFKALTSRSLPLPGRQAALSKALDSVVLLGFPEWSIWGIPLVGHEVGLAYVKEGRNSQLATLVDRHVSTDTTVPGEVFAGDGMAPAPPLRTRELVEQLLADAFATYTLGLSYACAALLLRLSPRHDEPPRADHPRDVDRARVIRMTLRAGGRSAPAGGGAYADCVTDLEQIWESAVVAHAAPNEASAARQEVEGPPPEKDWLDDLTLDAINHFREMTMIRPYNEERWRNSQVWFDTLQQDQSVGPLWSPEWDAVPDVLTAAWRLRLISAQEPNVLAAQVQRRWSSRRKGG